MVKTLTERTVTKNDIFRVLRRTQSDAGLPADGVFKIHSVRVSTITDLLENGAELRNVQRLAGHADPRTTQLYFHGDDDVTRHLVETIS